MDVVLLVAGDIPYANHATARCPKTNFAIRSMCSRLVSGNNSDRKLSRQFASNPRYPAHVQRAVSACRGVQLAEVTKERQCLIDGAVAPSQRDPSGFNVESREQARVSAKRAASGQKINLKNLKSE